MPKLWQIASGQLYENTTVLTYPMYVERGPKQVFGLRGPWERRGPLRQGDTSISCQREQLLR